MVSSVLTGCLNSGALTRVVLDEMLAPGSAIERVSIQPAQRKRNEQSDPPFAKDKTIDGRPPWVSQLSLRSATRHEISEGVKKFTVNSRNWRLICNIEHRTARSVRRLAIFGVRHGYESWIESQMKEVREEWPTLREEQTREG